MRRVRAGEIVAGAGGVLLLVSMFLDWYGRRRPRGRPERLGGVRRRRPAAGARRAARDRARAQPGRRPRARAAGRARRDHDDARRWPPRCCVLYRILNQPGPNDAIGVERGRVARPRGGDRRLPAAPGWRSATSARGRPIRRRPSPSAARPPRAPKIHAMSLSRDQVLHVARLARLELTEEEVEPLRRRALEGARLTSRRSTSSSDLDDVEPTSHVVDVENALRADEPTPSLPQEEALAAAPDPAQGGFRVPSPGAGGEPDERAARADRRPGGRGDPARRGRARGAVERLPRARGRRRAQRLHVGRERRAARRRARRAAGRRPGGRQGPVRHRRAIPSQAGSKILERLPPAVHGHRGRAAHRRRRARCWARPTRTSSRWAPRPSTPPTGRR